ncbi:MAG: hypothetical protein GY861_19785 [bacterium]|nr:hypothetical protein [bacterium]
MYCGRTIDRDKWKSEFISELHYKTMECECGKKNKIIVHFHGSGHDNWSELEKKALRVMGKKQ